MKTKINLKRTFYALTAALITFTSCEKSDLQNTDTTASSNTIAVPASLSAITSSTGSVSSTTADSVYVMQECARHGRRDSVAQSALPANVSTYLSGNYAGNTFHKAFAIKNSSGTITGYVAIVYYNDKPVAIEFDNAGNFVKVLEQREKGDLGGKGHHHGGRFEHRDGQQRDSIALSSLAPAITSYFSANYPTDTLVKAFRNRDSSIVVLSKNNGAFATVFSASGTFVKRSTLHARSGKAQPVELAALPSQAANYLSQTYPNYVFMKAFALQQSGTLKGYVVVIDANNTKYAVEFDAAGNFVSAKTIR